jgi:hypothetical protein
MISIRWAYIVGQNANTVTQPSYGDPNTMGSAPTAPQPYGGSIDPRMLAAARQGLYNPDDRFNRGNQQFGEQTPPQNDTSEEDPAKKASAGEIAAYAGAGAVSGVAMGKALGTMDKEAGFFDKLAKGFGKIPGISHLDEKLDSNLARNVEKYPNWLKELIHADAVVAKGTSPEAQAAATEKHMAAVRGRRIQTLPTSLGKHQEVLEKLGGADLLDTDALKKLDAEGLSKDLEAKTTQLDDLVKAGTLTDKEAKGVKKALINSHLPVLMGQLDDSAGKLARQTARLSSNGVGPMGRAFRTSGTYLSRSVSADAANSLALSDGSIKQKAASFTSKAFGPALMGIFTVVPAALEAKKAEKGDKTRSFFHNFIGTGISTAIGFEVGKRFIHATGLPAKLPGANRVIIPLVRITAGRFVAGLGAMFIFGTAFQKIGEKISNAIFGKPKSAQKQKLPAMPTQAKTTAS